MPDYMALLEYVFSAVILVLAVVIIYLIRASKGKSRSIRTGGGEHIQDRGGRGGRRRAWKSRSTLSESVVKGKVWEQIAPYLPEFEYNPADARFVGDPIDYIIFSGMSDGDGPVEVIVADIKTGRAQLSGNQRRIREAIEGGHVSFKLIRLHDRSSE